MQVKIKKLDEKAVMPIKAHSTDAGFDLTATSKFTDKYGNLVYGTGLAFEIPEGYVGLLFPRSSISKKELSLCNAVGVLDSCYRGEVFFKFKELNVIVQDDIYNVGDRIGQLIILPYPEIEFIQTEELTNTDRGENGFGSTDKSVIQ